MIQFYYNLYTLKSEMNILLHIFMLILVKLLFINYYDIIQVNISITYKFKEWFYEKIYLKLFFIYILFFIIEDLLKIKLDKLSIGTAEIVPAGKYRFKSS